MKVDGLQSNLSYVSIRNNVKERTDNSPVDDGSSLGSNVLRSLTNVGDPTSSNVSTDKLLSTEKSRELLEQANAILKLSDSNIEFKLDESSGKVVFYIKDAASGEVLRQIPDESMLRLSENIKQFLEGGSTLSGSKQQSAVLSGLLADTKV